MGLPGSSDLENDHPPAGSGPVLPLYGGLWKCRLPPRAGFPGLGQGLGSRLAGHFIQYHHGPHGSRNRPLRLRHKAHTYGECSVSQGHPWDLNNETPSKKAL